MKPLKLVMSAFGPYAEKVEVNFEEFDGSGLFLITGDTGAGKTTIFDGISYALFNKTSGTDREVSSLRSDYADVSTPTYVEFTFSHQGREYIIRRNPEYLRPPKRGTKPTMEKANVVLIREPDAPLEKSKEVEPAIAEILRISFDQFKQISMIAQGEFRKVLNTNTKERGQILQKIFSTEGYKKMEFIMAERSKKANAALQETYRSVDQYFDGLQYEDDSLLKDKIKEEQKAESGKDRFRMNEKMQILDKLLQEDKEKAEKLKEDFESKKIVAEDRKTTYNLVHSVNEAFHKHDNAKKEFTLLEGKRPLYNEKADVLEKQKKVYFDIRPFFETAKNEDKRAKRFAENCEITKENLEKVSKEKGTADEELANVSSRKEEAEKMKLQAATIEKELDQYQRRDRLKVEVKELESNLTQAKEKQETLEKEKNQIKEVQDQRKIRKEELADSTAKKIKVEGNMREIKERHDGMARLLKVKFPDLEAAKADHEKAAVFYAKKRDAFDEIDSEYREYERKLEESRAGILASHLEEGQACPVCGSTHHPQLAKLPEENVTEEFLKTLKTKQEKADKEKNQAFTAAETAFAKVENEEKNLLEQVKNYIEEAEKSQWNEIKETLKTLVNQAKEEFYMLQKDREKYQAEEKELQEIVQKEKEFEGKLAKMEEDFNALTKSLTDLGSQKAGKEGELASLATLSYTGYREAKKAQESLKKDADEILDAILQAQKKLDECAKKEAALKAELDTLKIQSEEQTKRAREEKLKYKEAFEKAGFKDQAEVRAYDTSKEEIEATEKEISTFKENLAAKAAALELAAQGIEGKERVDEEAARIAAEESERERDLCQRQFDRVRNRRGANEDIKSKILQKQKMAEDQILEAGRLEGLKKLLNGSEAGQQKTSFETYVQTSGFEGIIRAANKRLVPMSGNRYQLFRHDDVESKQNASLDLDILDNYTGKRRPVSSLSGGESFLASLSLALGLSDHVTANAGGISVETLFIDEGFGTLDESSLNDAVNMLQQLSDGNKMVGIISHREELKEVIPRKILIEKTRKGSKIHIE